MNISEEQLMLLHMGELSPEESRELLKSPEVCERLKQLEADMQAFKTQLQNPLPDDYGHQLWQRISDKIAQPEATFKEPPWLRKVADWFHTPQFSFASMAMVAMLVLTAYWMGRQDVIDETDFGQQLLAQNIQMHLTQSEIFLTQAKNEDLGNIQLQTMAQRLLTSNRIYKRAAASHDGQHTALLLSNLEQILLEYANGAPSESTTLPALQDKSNRGQELLFQVKSMKQQMAKDDTII